MSKKKNKVTDIVKTVKKKGKDYTYNSDTQTYVVKLDSFRGKNVVIKKTKYDSMLRAYSNWTKDQASQEEMCRRFNFTREQMIELIKKFGWVHSSLPISDEDIVTKPVKDVVSDLVVQRRAEIEQKFSKQDWKQTQEDADNWREFVTNKRDPYIEAIKGLKPEPLAPVLYTGDWNKEQKYTILIGLNDIHFGSYSDPEEMVHKNEVNTELIRKKMRMYSTMLKERLGERKYAIKTAVVLVGGDILHTLTGKTSRGTDVDADVIGTTQWSYAMASCIDFLQTLLMFFPFVEVRVVKGNHAGLDEYNLFDAIRCWFRKEDRITFFLERARTAIFMVNKVMIALDHGDSDQIKNAKVPNPKDAPKLEAYIQSLFMSRPEMLVKAKSKLFLQADIHSFHQHEFSNFEFIRFGSMVGTDHYADTLNKSSKARQNAVIIDNENVKEVLHFIF